MSKVKGTRHLKKVTKHSVGSGERTENGANNVNIKTTQFELPPTAGLTVAIGISAYRSKLATNLALEISTAKRLHVPGGFTVLLKNSNVHRSEQNSALLLFYV